MDHYDGVGYFNETQARVDGERWRGHVMVAFAQLGSRADFGERTPSAGLTDDAIKQLEASNPVCGSTTRHPAKSSWCPANLGQCSLRCGLMA